MDILFSVVSVRRKGHLRVILSLSSCINNRKIKRQARNRYSMHIFLKEVLLSIVFAALYLSSDSVSAWTGGGGC